MSQQQQQTSMKNQPMKMIQPAGKGAIMSAYQKKYGKVPSSPKAMMKKPMKKLNKKMKKNSLSTSPMVKAAMGKAKVMNSVRKTMGY